MNTIAMDQSLPRNTHRRPTTDVFNGFVASIPALQGDLKAIWVFSANISATNSQDFTNGKAFFVALDESDSAAILSDQAVQQSLNGPLPDWNDTPSINLID